MELKLHINYYWVQTVIITHNSITIMWSKICVLISHMDYINDLQLNGIVSSAGFFQGMSSFFTAWEIQARWLCKFWLTRNYDNNGKIYSSEETERMRNAIAGFKASRPAWMNFFYVPGYYALNDTMAHEMGCLPPDYREVSIRFDFHIWFCSKKTVSIVQK